MTSKKWQLAEDSAKRYEDILVPTILGPFAKALVDRAFIKPNTTVIDVGCGTGAATRYAADKMGKSGRVIGVDVNPGMLSVARSLAYDGGATLEWRQASAYEVPLDDGSADAVLCAQTLQFLDEREQALNEMHRLLKVQQSAYVSLWCDLEENPYFDALVSAIARHISEDTAAGLGSAFNLTNLDTITALFTATRFSNVESTVSELILKLPPVDDFVPRHIHATPMGVGYGAASPETQQAILSDLKTQLAEYQTEAGMAVPFRSHLIRAIH